MLTIELINADALHIPLADNSVHCVVTSPPYYGLRNYKVAGQLGLEATVEEYVVNLVAAFREVKRVLRPEGTCWLVIGDSYAGSWGNYGARSGQQRSRIAERWHRPAYEDDRHGWNGLPPTVNPGGGLKPKDLIGVPWRVAFALQADGWWLRSDIIWAKPNCMTESVTDRPTKSHEYIFLLAKSERYYYDQDAIREPLAESTLADRRNGTGRHTQGKNASKYFENESPDNAKPDMPSWYRAKTFVNPESGRNKRSVWSINTVPYSGPHFATYPPALVEPCIKAGTSEAGCCSACGKPLRRVVEYKANYIKRETAHAWNNEPSKVDSSGWSYPTRKHKGWQPSCSCNAPIVPCTVLDPFVGSGTALLVARALGRNAIGIDLSYAYLHDQARCRLELDRLDEWQESLAKKDVSIFEDLPLFNCTEREDT